MKTPFRVTWAKDTPLSPEDVLCVITEGELEGNRVNIHAKSIFHIRIVHDSVAGLLWLTNISTMSKRHSN